MSESLISLSDLNFYLTGKRVVVVGPAASMQGSGLGADIDSFDVVVRVNKAFPVVASEANDFGTRLDVLYNCMNPDPECGGRLDDKALKQANVKFVVCPLAEVAPFDKDIQAWRARKPVVPWTVTSTTTYRELEHNVKPSRPNTGIAAIWDLLHRPVASVHVVGFTFFRGGYHKSYRPYSETQVLNFMNQHGHHKQGPQLMEFCRWTKVYPTKLTMDTVLSNIVSIAQKVTVVVPIKDNSERVPGKNFIDCGGRPLMEWVISMLAACPVVHQIIIDTDSDKVVNIVQTYNHSHIKIHRREPALCGDHVSTVKLLERVVSLYPPETELIMHTHVTNPLLSSDTVVKAVTTFLKSRDHDSLMGVNCIQSRLYDHLSNAINHNPDILLRTQDLQPLYEENSCLYIIPLSTLQTQHARVGKRPLLFETPVHESYDIDTLADLQLVDSLMSHKYRRHHVKED